MAHEVQMRCSACGVQRLGEAAPLAQALGKAVRQMAEMKTVEGHVRADEGRWVADGVQVQSNPCVQRLAEAAHLAQALR